MLNLIAPNQEVPEYPEGGPWPLAMLFIGDGGEPKTALSDTHTALLGALIPKYLDLPETPEGHDSALVARYEHAVALANSIQGDLAAQAADAGHFDPASESEDVLTAIFTEKTEAFTGVPAADGELNLAWEHEVPLVLIDTDYAPYTARTRPTGRTVWLNPSTEVEYLASLAELGFIRQLVAADM